MGCPFREGDEGDREPDDGTATGESDGGGDGGETTGSPGVDRRDFMRTALAIGGASALSTTVGFFGMPEASAAEGGVTVAERANRQHSWNAYESRAHGTFLPPSHHLLLFASYEDEGEPAAEDRVEVREALDRLEEAFAWDHEGLLFAVGYSMSYFDRFESDPPRGLRTDNGAIPRMLTAQQLIDGPTVPILDPERPDFQPTEDEGEEERRIDLTVTLPREDPVADDDYDVVVHLASDHVQHLLAAEQVLWGSRESVNGVPFVDANFDGVFTRPTEYPDRRTGFVGNDPLDENVEAVGDVLSTTRARFNEAVEQGADLSMGYNDLYKNSVPREDNVTILEDQRFLPGPPNWQPPEHFANGSIMHVSRLDNDLKGWYGDNTDTERRHRMFSPHHTKDDVGEIGENLAPRESSAPVAEEKPESERIPMRDLSDDVRDAAERVEEDYREDRTLGHAQKTARARAQLEAHFRNEDGGPPVDVPQRDDAVARERDDDLAGTDDGDQQIETGFLRRDFNTVDGGRPGTHFVALQAFSIYLAYMRHAMNGVDFDTAMIAQPTTADGTAGFDHDADDGENPDHGILEYVTTRRRGNFVLPPIRARALPHASSVKLVEDGIEPETGLGDAPLPPYVDPDDTFELERDADRFRLALTGEIADRIDHGSVRFGFYRAVNAGAGAEPADVVETADGVTYVFEISETTLPEQFEREATDDERPDDATVRARLHAERDDDRKPVFGTTTLADRLGMADVRETIEAYENGAVDFETVAETVRAYNDD
ncbi:hypothetical protein BRD17_09905 [Halobacteriales archaeon SW_7_68_16]|nr:MAG: hypothetical protein BRD17_09905 [Halobacteriales archaeon SW_7_68_16]